MCSQELRKVAEEELTGVEAELERESSEDNELRDKYGNQWSRATSSALNSTMREKAAGRRFTPSAFHTMTALRI
jgi:hypothetical protein